MGRAFVIRIAACSLLFPGIALAELSLDPIRAGSTFRQSSGQDPRIFAREPYSPLFVVCGGTNIHRGFMVFDLSGVPEDATITAASLNFVQAATGAPTLEVWGGYQPGEIAYDTYFGLDNTGGWAVVYPTDAPFSSMTTDGLLFGQIAMNQASGNGSPVSVDLSGNGGLAYFQSQIGSAMLLCTRVAGDMEYYNGHHGGDGQAMPTLSVAYEVPEPGTGVLAGLLLTALVARFRRRVA